MRADSLYRRVRALESKAPEPGDEEKTLLRRVLSMCTDEELDRCEEIAQRFEIEHLEPTIEERSFLEEVWGKVCSLKLLANGCPPWKSGTPLP